ncbi:hypothetical protein BGZ83_002698 [Gryganskiella cystojenkinii]|nr:hypothetical protein BGZ83_002698 [Gryganskiella cystojenkinii]
MKERSARAAKQRATEKLHEIGENDAELVQYLQGEGDEPQLKKQIKRSGTDETSDHGDRNVLDDSDSADGESWKPDVKKKKRRRSSLSGSGSDDDIKRNKIPNTHQHHESDQEDEDENSDADRSQRPMNDANKAKKKKRRNSKADEGDPSSKKKNKNKVDNNKKKKKKPRSISFEDEVHATNADRESDSDNRERSEDEDRVAQGSGEDVSIAGNSKKKKKKKDKKVKKRAKTTTEADNEDNDEDNDTSNGDKIQDKDEGGQRIEKASLYFGTQYSKGVKPLSSMVHTLLSQEQKAARTLALSALEPRRDDETYRWPVREELLPATMPMDPFVDLPKQPQEGDEHALRFVQELTGVPKTEKDYSDSSSEGESEEEMQVEKNEREEEYDSEAEEAIREAFQKRARAARKKLKRERHADERAATTRLLQVQKLFNQEMTNFGRVQYRKGREHGMSNEEAAKFRRRCLPDFRNLAVRTSNTSTSATRTTTTINRSSSTGTTGAGQADDDPQEDLTTLQERALTFAAEDRTRKILNRLPWVIRQGALGSAPEYVVKGIPKPVSSEAEFERGWDTIMTAASLAGVEDRILKKVGLRMKSLLSHSIHPGRYEPAPKARFADSTTQGNDAIAQSSTPFYSTGEFIDPLDPRFRKEALLRNKRLRESQVPFRHPSREGKRKEKQKEKEKGKAQQLSSPSELLSDQ